MSKGSMEEIEWLENKKTEITSITEESKSLVHIPQEIVDNILFRLPIKTLCRFKSVSRAWNSSISNPMFDSTHSVFTIYKSSEGQFFRNITEQGTSTDMFPVPWPDSDSKVRVSNSCNGMVLICVGTWFYLFNPSTHYIAKVLEQNYLLETDKCYFNMFIGLYYDDSSSDYKAVVLFQHRSHLRISIVVEASLKGKQWNRPNSCKNLNDVTVGPIVNGQLHWLNDGKIIRYDPVSKVFKELQSFQPKGSGIVGIGILEGCLCVSRNLNKMKIEILSMKEYGVSESWTPIFSRTFGRRCSSKTFDLRWFKFNPLLLTRAGEILISMKNKVWVLNLSKQTWEEYCPSNKGVLTSAVWFDQNMDTPIGF